MRDPTVLILGKFGCDSEVLNSTHFSYHRRSYFRSRSDEPPVPVFEAIKVRRRFNPTIVITRDISQISSDLIYVLRGGITVEQGYRENLELSKGAFSELVAIQSCTGGFVPRNNIGGSRRRRIGNTVARVTSW